MMLNEPITYRPYAVIAIDPGVTTGFAHVDLASSEVMYVQTLNFWEAYEQILEEDRGHVFVVIESSKPVKHIWQKPGGANGRVMGAVGRSIGENNAHAELLAEGLRRKGYYVKTVNPSRTKLDADTVKRITGYEGRTNEHNRDAIMIAWAHRQRQLVQEYAKDIYKRECLS